MSKFLLIPIADGMPDPAWSLSWHAEPCEIVAETPELARRLAAGRFTVAVHPGKPLASLGSPWLDRRLVHVQPLEPTGFGFDPTRPGAQNEQHS
ncbi:hypothetical protein QWZ14_27695 [Paeniroseomonas aquatica]|uniref:Uncharacterized protein n=2 Tax=Paeniroseomonas aquatica TaxID=373043 RepID=A0ABT8AF38_9PROT|nr:hypothetical protein [Paeniroseomonas aquatica]MDN3568181.1 hypothetical protein [Paeniroseomonas aquatica]